MIYYVYITMITTNNTKLALALLVIATAAIGFTVATPILVGNASADNGLAHEKNFGQCKQDKNDQACQSNKDKFTGNN
jgi:mannitol-specific phosphotransferase system IIBC component